MTYIEFIAKMIKEQKISEPIYTADIAETLAKKYNLEIQKSNAAVSVAMKRIIESDKIVNLRFYQKGIYYLTVQTASGEMEINKESLIQRKYLLHNIGYESGYSALYSLGLITKIPTERIIVTNKAKDAIRLDKSLNVYIRPPKVEVTNENKKYLQFLDVLELIDKTSLDVDNHYEILADCLKRQDMDYRQLLALADRYYNKNTIYHIARIASEEENSLESSGVEYITGIHALNIPCSLNTSGDWHTSALVWDSPNVKNSKESIWGDYGIEVSEYVPEHTGRYYVANHIRACLDLLADGRFSVAQSMKEDFICNDDYNEEIFSQVSKMKDMPHWDGVRNFMKKEYRMSWLNYERRFLNV